MKKRLVSLGLCALMLSSAVTLLASCGDDVQETEEVIPPITLTLNMITDGRTTGEGIAAVQEAINLITENDLNTHVVLQLYTKDAYLDAIKEKLLKREEDYLAGNVYSSIGSEEDKILKEIVPGQYRTITDYPKVYDNQLDVFVIAGYDMFTELELYMTAIYDTSGELNDTAALTKKYVSDQLLTYGVYNEEQKAIPGNAYYGNYEYLLINREIFDDTPFAIGDVDGLASIGDFLAYVGASEKYHDVTPLYNVGSLGLLGIDGVDGSVVSSYIPDGTQEADTSLYPVNILRNANVRAQVNAIIAAGASGGKYANGQRSIDPALLSDPDAKFAAAFIEGTADLPENKEIAENYYVIKTRNPVADQDELFSSMFAVCSYSSDPARCMDLVNMLMTNETLLNTLLYGVENVTYTRDELTHVVDRKYSADPTSDSNAVYIMDENLIGNTFLAWQNSDMSEEMLKVSANGWELAKQASTDATFSPFARFVPEWSAKLTDHSLILKDRYDELWAKLPEFSYRVNNATGELYTIDEYCDYLASWLALQSEVNFMANASYNPKEGEDQSLPFATQYLAWWQERYASAG